ncbi:T9SS type A sorting domain-containing protein [Carboxylicivirga linearis]|uniref:T9SS type A sorting domain-containing protein n=1 Tax=Carboxylicivirga linearis TaxID=1628157 RepID=A0ABS5JZF8_9BACT|nr:T9SS type A sorting domain-containing protein [Carboxylicivirga linearis]MBS2099781.1 T9SS type A sorting domain-containing protein [Carboxylicivirga linearis]
MKRQLFKYTSFAIACALSVSSLYYLYNSKIEQKVKPATRIKSSFSPKAKASTIDGRNEYFFQVLRNPETNEIPKGIRSKEAELFKSLKSLNLKSSQAENYTWTEIGPHDVGGRTRALAIDVRDANHVIAGGVSGGIWNSTDKGASWSLQTTQTGSFAVNSICQDTRVGHQDTWYYVGGEFSGNSANARSANYTGYGLHRSTDNGITWEAIIDDTNPYVWNSLLDYASKVMVDPITGTIFIASNSYGIIYAYEDNGEYLIGPVIGGSNDHYYADFDIDASGNMIVVLSESGYDIEKDYEAGVYYKTASASVFTKIDMESINPDGFPSSFDRSVIRFAPSNPNIAYVYTVDGSTPYFHVATINQTTVSDSYLSDRTGNLPSYGNLGSQGSYNMTLAVKPDDEDFVIIGSTSLFRSNDAFATTPEIDYGWIGGYGPDGADDYMYPNHHPDCHITVFDPQNADAVWSGHDGGLSYLTDITLSTTIPELLPWQDMNNGYNITQFYTLANSMGANEDRYLGGTQDNGSPYFKTSNSSSTDISSGDGAYCYLSPTYAYISTQNGSLMRTGYNESTGDPLNPFSSSGPYNWSQITPTDATGQLFINPFCIDPVGDTTMYYAGGEQLWINLNVDKISNYNSGTTMEGWYAPSALDAPGELITALTSSKVPDHILYYATYTGTYPKLYKVDNSIAVESEITREEITISSAAQDSYPYYIAVNPYDANEIIVVFANYGVPSLFHSTDGGDTFSIIDGNLTATESLPGPSIRSAAILNWNGEKTYYISTSIGVYQTNLLNGSSTQWVNVDNNNLGNVVCNRVKANEFDGKVVIATHGRGIFKGESANKLYIHNKLPNLQRLTTSVNDAINISDLFMHQTGAEISLSLANNSDPLVASASINSNLLTIDYSNSSEGQALITIEATSGTDVAQFTFSVTVTKDATTGLENQSRNEYSGKDLKIYPNPNKGLFKIQLENNINETAQVKIYSINGQLIYSRSFVDANDLTNFEFDITEVSSGYYLVVIESENRTLKKKILKE